MGRKGLYIVRELLLWVIALQLLNLSVGSVFAWDNDYDYAYTYNKTYDPTETAVEWIVELTYGQQPAFSYDIHQDGGKCLLKTFHWKTDLQPALPKPMYFSIVRRPRTDIPAGALASSAADMVTPPPEVSAA
jgi:hypothetical protein